MIRSLTSRFAVGGCSSPDRPLTLPACRWEGARRLSAQALSATVVAALLIATPLAASAKPSGGESEDDWGGWQGLDSGFLGRPRQAKNLDLPLEERRFDTTDLRHAEARRLAKEIRRAERKGKGHQRGKGRGHSRSSADTQTAQTTVSAATLQQALTLEATLAPVTTVTAAWLRTGEAGLYAVPVADLAQGMGQTESAIRNSASGGSLSLATGGQATPWYFDVANDQILFAGEAYQTFYTDENAHRLALGAATGNPMAVTGTKFTRRKGAARPFRDTLIFEEEKSCETCLKYDTRTLAYASEPDADYWFWDYLSAGYKDEIQVALQVPNPAPSGTAELRVRLRGWTDLVAGDEHRVYAELNGTSVGSTLVWDGFAEAVLVADVDQGLLDPSGNNTLTLRNDYDPGTHPGEYLDDVEIDYVRLPVASDGALWLHEIGKGVQAVSNFGSPDILVVESPTGSAVLRQDARVERDSAGGWQVTFIVDATADYLVVERGALGTAAVAPDYPVVPSLASLENEVDYLIITAPEFLGTAEALAAHRSVDFGSVKVVRLDDVYDEFSFGRVDPTAITRFMDQVREWTHVPSVVTLVGKGTVDEKDRMGYGDSFLPVALTVTPWSLAASDDRLLGIDGDVPFAIGRLAITSDAEGLAYVEQKLASYESDGLGGERRAVLAADNPDEGGDFHLNSDLLAERLLDLDFTAVTTLYHPDDPVSTSLAASSTWETEYVSYDGHGSYTQVGNSRENFITVASATALSNEILPLFTALTCAAGNDAHPGVRSLASALVLNPSGGAVAAAAPSGLSLDADAQTLGNALVDRLFDPFEPNTFGGALGGAKADTAGEIPGFMARIYSVVGEPAVRAR